MNLKIGNGWGSLRRDIRLPESGNATPVQTKSFADTMRDQREQSKQERLNQIMSMIQQQAEHLRRNMTVKELRKYKLLIKQFLEETVKQGVGIKDTRGWDRRGRSRRYKLIEEVDRHLLDMTDELLANEQGRMDILGRVGEIKGLLVNLAY